MDAMDESKIKELLESVQQGACSVFDALQRFVRLVKANHFDLFKLLRLLQRFKFERRRDALAVLAPILCERVVRLRFDAIVPVPRPTPLTSVTKPW